MDSSEEKKEKTKKSTKKKRSGKYSRAKGNRYELLIVNELKEKGYEAVTSRSESKNMDNEKVDIISNFKFHIQAKVTQSRPNYVEILNSFRLKDKPLAIFHKSQTKKNTNCVSEGEFVIIRKEDFYNLIKKDE